MTTLVAICIMILSFVYVMFHVAILRKSKKMHAREKELLANGVIPYGSGLCHGMVVDQDRPNAVIHDSKKSNSWYGRLV
jgi:hypothetical protein